MKRIFIIVVTLLLFPKIVFAQCSNSDLARLKKLASNISYVIEENDGTISVTFTGVSNELAISLYNRQYNYSDELGEIKFYGMKGGLSYNFDVYGNENCTYNLIKQIDVTISRLNDYYDDPICEQARGYKYCQKWIDKYVDYEELQKGIEQYLNTKPNDGNNNKPSITNAGHDFYYYYNKYYWLALGMSIAILGILIYLWIKQNKKNQL